MSSVTLDKLAEGMIVIKDVTDRNGRCLLAQGNPITSKHLRIFKMWGVSSVEIEGDDTAKPQATVTQENATGYPVSEGDLKSRFQHANLDHPMMTKLFEQCQVRQK